MTFNTCYSPPILFLPPLPEVKSSYIPPWYLKVIKVIGNIVKRILDFLCFWREKKTACWSDVEVQSINKLRNAEYYEARKVYLKNRGRLIAEPSNSSKISGDAKEVKANKTLYSEREFTPPLESGRQCLREFVDHSIESIHEVVIAPPMENRYVFFDELTTIIKILSEVILKLGNHAKDQIFQSLEECNFDPTALSVSLQNTLTWLLKVDEIKDLDCLKKSLAIELKSFCCKDATPIENIDDTIEIVFTWFFSQEQRAKSIEAHTDHKDLSSIHRVQRHLISLLVEKKIDQLNIKTKTTLINDLPTITYEMLKKNTARITDEISGRLAELIEHIDIEETLDRIVHIIYDHIKAYIAAKNSVEADLKTANVTPKTTDQLSAHFYKEIPLYFTTLPTTHQAVKEMIHGSEDHQDKELWKRSVAQRSIKNATATVIDILFPTVKLEIGDEVKDIEGLSYLWSILELPVEWHNLIKEIEGFAQQILPKGVTITDKIKADIHENIRDIVVAIVNVKLKKSASENCMRLYEMLTSPMNLQKILAGYLLPSTFSTTLKIHIQNILLHNIEHFEAAINALKKEVCNENSKKTFTNLLFDLLTKHCKQLDLKLAGINELEFKTTFAEPLISIIQGALDCPELKEKKLSDVLEKALHLAVGKKKNVYSETIMDLIFQVGEFGSFTGKIASFYTDSVNGLIGGMLNILTQEPYTVIDLACAKMKKFLGTKEAVNNFYFSEKPVVDTSEERMENEIKKLAALMHDIATENCSARDKKSWVGSYLISSVRATQAFIGHDSTPIENLMRGLFNKLLRNEVLNAQLYFKIQDLAVATLQNADKLINEDRDTENKKVSAKTLSGQY